MVLHSTLSGANLHDPKGKNPTPLDLVDNLSLAYQIRNTSAGATVLGIDTIDSAEHVHSSINLVTLNADASISLAETCTLRLRAANIITGVQTNSLTAGGSGRLTFSNDSAGTPTSAFFDLGTLGLTGTNNLAPRLTFNGTTNVGAVNTGALSVEYDSTRVRGYYQFGNLFEIKIDNGSSSFILGGGTHGTYTTLANTIIIGADANSAASSLNLQFGVCIGSSATIVGNSSVSVGYQAAAASLNTTAVGASTNSSGDFSTSLGANAQCTAAGDYGVSLGRTNVVSALGGIAIGTSVACDTAHYAVLGGDDGNGYIDTLVVGRGIRSTTSQPTTTITTTNGNGGNTNGSNLQILGGLGAGASGTDGDVIFSGASGTGNPHTITERGRIKAQTGNLQLMQRNNAEYLRAESVAELKTLDIAAFSDTTVACQIPANSLMIGLSARVTTTVTGAGLSSIDVGVAGDTARFGNIPTFTAGNTFQGYDATQGVRLYTTATSIRFTGVGGSFTAGAIRVTLYYLKFSPATS